MRGKIVQCVPNFSEGRRPDVIKAIVDAIAAAEVRVLDVQSDADHNRSVVTFIGAPDHVVEAAFSGVRCAGQLIDMNEHRGEHPRIGAADVVPFVPVSKINMDECKKLAERLAMRIGNELSIPVYLYGAAATTVDRRELPAVRKGEFEGLGQRMAGEQGRADFGPAEPHATAGAVIVGARPPLIAYNVNLRTSDLGIAKAIARAVRESTGGLKNVRAIGLALAGTDLVQVSMNLVDYQKTPVARVFDMVRREAERYGVMVAGSEIVGLVPQQALVEAAAHFLNLQGFRSDQVLEAWLIEQ